MFDFFKDIFVVTTPTEIIGLIIGCVVISIILLVLLINLFAKIISGVSWLITRIRKS